MPVGKTLLSDESSDEGQDVVDDEFGLLPETDVINFGKKCFVCVHFRKPQRVISQMFMVFRKASVVFQEAFHFRILR